MPQDGFVTSGQQGLGFSITLYPYEGAGAGDVLHLGFDVVVLDFIQPPRLEWHQGEGGFRAAGLAGACVCTDLGGLAEKNLLGPLGTGHGGYQRNQKGKCLFQA